MTNRAIIFCDGACKGNPGPGGFAAKIYYLDKDPKIVIGRESNTTNNRMEMLAIIEGLNWIYASVDQKYRKYITITLFSDSIYCVNTIKDWIHRWEKDESIETRPNSDLLKQLLEILNKVKVDARWIQRVSNPYAWSVDKLANERRIEN